MGHEAGNSSPKVRALVPKDAASVIVIDRSGATPRLLMGRRRADLAFLAGKYVFPGGRVDAADKSAPAAINPSDETIAALLRGMRGRPSRHRARALVIAAARELYEEAGYALGQPSSPDLSRLNYFARAITPPARTRRYDTRFFLADARHAIRGHHHGDGELLDLAWLSLDEIGRLDLPGITRLLLSDIATQLIAAPTDTQTGAKPPIPFYYQRSGIQHRTLL